MASHLLFLDFSGGEFMLIAVVFLMFFGSKSIPGVAKSLGKAIREFKDAANNVQREIQDSAGVNEIKETLNPSPTTQTPSITEPQQHKAEEIPHDTAGQTELPL
jgi:sec-independent protein translocase protein TatA